MADAATRQLVQQIVMNQIAAGAMFTAFDITVLARQQGAQLRHDEGRDIVHDMFQSGNMGAGYQRTVIDVGAPSKPFLYHRLSDDPKNYRSGSTTPQPNVSGAPASAQQPTPGASQTPASQPLGKLRRFVSNLLGGGSAKPPAQSQPARPGSTSGSSSGPRVASGGGTPPPPPRGPGPMNLDGSAFLPITRGELFQKAKGINLWGSPWFGRRDLIPPVTDERTQLIDRAMLAGGLLTNEELQEIHRVGALMDYYRPSEILIASTSQKAGKEASDAEKLRKSEEKAKKKAESKARQDARREAIKHRKANDILYLGRGVSSQLGQRQSHLELLTQLGLPVLATPADVANALSISIPRLRWLAFHNDVAVRIHYVRFEIAKKSGGTRMLSAPHAQLAQAQKWILENILNKLPTEPCAHGFVRGCSILTNALPHVGHSVVINMDLEGFFPSITFPRIRKVFERLGYSPAVSTVLALICSESPRRSATYEGRLYLVAAGPRALPQGACTSPAISNQIAKRLDRRLQSLSERLKLTYTRYADDLTVSGDEELESRIGYVMACVRHIAQDSGFEVNEKKSRVLRRSTAQTVTGLVVNDKATVSREKIRRIRAILHHARTEGLSAQNRDQYPNFRSWLEGMIGFISMTRPELGKKFLEELSTLK
jgi:RNA-directed DNA polymerase